MALDEKQKEKREKLNRNNQNRLGLGGAVFRIQDSSGGSDDQKRRNTTQRTVGKKEMWGPCDFSVMSGRSEFPRKGWVGVNKCSHKQKVSKGLGNGVESKKTKRGEGRKIENTTSFYGNRKF